MSISSLSVVSSDTSVSLLPALPQLLISCAAEGAVTLAADIAVVVSDALTDGVVAAVCLALIVAN